MSRIFELVNVHGVVKCLTRALDNLGPQVNIDTVRGIAEKLKFRVKERELPGRGGIPPIFEYVFDRKREPGNLIIFSINGFSVDAKSSPLLLDYIGMAYNWLEEGIDVGSFIESSDTSKAVHLTTLGITATLECIVQPQAKGSLSIPLFLQRPFAVGKKKRKFHGFGMNLHPLTIRLTSSYSLQDTVHKMVDVEPFVKDVGNKFRLVLTCKFTSIDNVENQIKNLQNDVDAFLRDLFAFKKG